MMPSSLWYVKVIEIELQHVIPWEYICENVISKAVHAFSITPYKSISSVK